METIERTAIGGATSPMRHANAGPSTVVRRLTINGVLAAPSMAATMLVAGVGFFVL